MEEEAVQPMKGRRPISQIVPGSRQMEGAGVEITRTVGSTALPNIDPYLMLDELKLPATEAFRGFPDHPHRGFETCSIMLSGEIEHRDSAGNRGVIGPGGVQWMTAGRGIVHSEMPRAIDGVLLHGFQLWINLPKRLKMIKPHYQDYQARDIPVVEHDSASVRVMAGTSLNTTGPIKMRNPGMLLDVRLTEGASLLQPVPSDWTGFAYVYEGSGRISGAKTKLRSAHVLGEGDHILAQAGAAKPGQKGGLAFLLIAGRPIREPIVQRGPFVMNTEAEIRQAFREYEMGMLQNPLDNPWHDDDEL